MSDQQKKEPRLRFKAPNGEGHDVTHQITIAGARLVQPYLLRGYQFVLVTEQPLDQVALPNIGEHHHVEVPVAAQPRKPYRGDDTTDRQRLLDTLRSTGKPLSSGDLEAATTIPRGVVRRLLHGAPGVTESGNSRSTRYATTPPAVAEAQP